MPRIHRFYVTYTANTPDATGIMRSVNGRISVTREYDIRVIDDVLAIEAEIERMFPTNRDVIIQGWIRYADISPGD